MRTPSKQCLHLVERECSIWLADQRDYYIAFSHSPSSPPYSFRFSTKFCLFGVWLTLSQWQSVFLISKNSLHNRCQFTIPSLMGKVWSYLHITQGDTINWFPFSLPSTTEIRVKVSTFPKNTILKQLKCQYSLVSLAFGAQLHIPLIIYDPLSRWWCSKGPASTLQIFTL